MGRTRGSSVRTRDAYVVSAARAECRVPSMNTFAYQYWYLLCFRERLADTALSIILLRVRRLIVGRARYLGTSHREVSPNVTMSVAPTSSSVVPGSSATPSRASSAPRRVGGFSSSSSLVARSRVASRSAAFPARPRGARLRRPRPRPGRSRRDRAQPRLRRGDVVSRPGR